MLVWTISLAQGDPIAAPEYKIKAAFLYNFAKLTEWPADAFRTDDRVFRIGITGADPVNDFLEQQTRNRELDGRKILVVRIKTPEDALRCQIVYIANSTRNDLDEMLKILRHRPILTVSEIDRFSERGGMIHLFKHKDVFRFQVRRSAIKESQLKVSSRLLALAEIAPEEKQ